MDDGSHNLNAPDTAEKCIRCRNKKSAGNISIVAENVKINETILLIKKGESKVIEHMFQKNYDRMVLCQYVFY